MAGIVASWLVPLVTHLFGADWLLPPLIVLVVATLLRGGTTLLDRLMLAIGVLLGAVCVGGLVLSVWPWHLQPVPIAGTALSALTLLAVGLGRRPRLPRLVSWVDLVVAPAIALAGLLFWWPFRDRDLAGDLALVVYGEDVARHFMLFDSIRLGGGYAFLRPDAAQTYLADGFSTYPQGTHLTFAVLESFVRSSGDVASPLTAMQHFLWYHIGVQVFLAAAVIWSLRRIAGRHLHPATAAPVLAAVVTYLAFDGPATIFLQGFTSEIAGLAALAMLAAITARPIKGVHEQALVVAALLAAVSFTYYLWLPIALAAVVQWLLRYRAELRDNRRMVAVTMVVAGAAAAVPPLVNARVDVSTAVLAFGGVIPLNLSVLVLLCAGTIAVSLLGPARRHRVAQSIGTLLVVSLAVSAVVGSYQWQVSGGTSYYFTKCLHASMILALVGLGAVALSAARHGALPAVERESPPAFGLGSPPDWWYLVSRLAVVVPVLVAAHWVYSDALAQDALSPPSIAWSRLYLRHHPTERPKAAAEIVQAVRWYPTADGVVTVSMRNDLETNYISTVYIGVLQRNYRRTQVTAAWLHKSQKMSRDEREARLPLESPYRIRLVSPPPPG